MTDRDEALEIAKYYGEQWTSNSEMSKLARAYIAQHTELVLLRAVAEAGEEYVVSINSVEDSTVCYVALKKALAAWKDQDA